jgi:hypothetical protein
MPTHTSRSPHGTRHDSLTAASTELVAVLIVLVCASTRRDPLHDALAHESRGQPHQWAFVERPSLRLANVFAGLASVFDAPADECR